MAWSAHDVAGACAGELEAHDVVYLGAGLPRLLREHVAGRAVIAVDGGGLVGIGPSPRGRDRGLQPAEGGESVTVISGGAIVGPVRVAAMLRRGWIDVGVIEAGQVDAAGALALPGEETSLGHLREIAYGVGRLIACLQHRMPDGRSALRDRLEQDEIALGSANVALVVTDLGIFRPAENGFELLKSAPAVDLAELESCTGAPLIDRRPGHSDVTDSETSAAPEQDDDDDLLASAAPPPD